MMLEQINTEPLVPYTDCTLQDIKEYYDYHQDKTSRHRIPTLPEKWEELDAEYQEKIINRIKAIGKISVEVELQRINKNFASAIKNLIPLTIRGIAYEQTLSSQNKEHKC